MASCSKSHGSLKIKITKEKPEDNKRQKIYEHEDAYDAGDNKTKTSSSELRAVEVPEAGASYNPDQTSHQKLLEKAASIRLKDLAEEKKYMRYNRFNSKLGIYEVDLQTDTDQQEDETTEETLNSENKSRITPLPERKTKVERNKEKRRRLHEIEMRKKVEEKKKRIEIENMHESLNEIKAKESNLEERKKIKELVKLSSGYKIKKLGKIKHREDEPAFLLSEQLPKSLRQVSTAQSVLEDRFNSLKRRNIIEARVPAKQTLKYRRKVVDRVK